MRADPTDYDSPWKEALERYFPHFMAFFFPPAHADIGWNLGYEFLDKELQQVTADAEVGRRMADKLVKVWRKAGQEAWVLVHIEIQGQQEADFARRMYIYNYRLYDRYEKEVASLVVLGDEQAGWRPDEFRYVLWGSRAGLKFPVVKLLDYRERWRELEASRNPFATVVMTHLKAQETRQDMEGRRAWKFRLTRRLYEQGYGREEVLQLFRFIDWMLRLPKDLEAAFWQEVQAYEEGQKMTYITSVERIGMEKGEIKAAREYVLEVLQTRFEEVPDSIAEGIAQIEDLERLRGLLRQAVKIGSLEAFRQALTV